MMMIATKLRLIVNFFRIKYLLNQLPIQLKTHKEFHWKILRSSYSEIFTEIDQNPSVEVQQHFSEIFSLEQIQAENERLRWEYQKLIEASNQSIQKQER